jgi:small acid-soluble spore protein E (minor gamma-type SASP)
MANQQPNKTASGTNVQHVKQQNAQSAQGQAGQQFGTEFASETDVQKVKQQNAQSAQRAQQASTQGQNPQQ